MSFSCMCVSAPKSFNASGGMKRWLDPLELASWMVGCCYVSAGSEPESSVRAASTLNC